MYDFALREILFSRKEGKAMKAPGVCSTGGSCWLTIGQLVRGKKTCQPLRHQHWLQIHLLILLLGHASCIDTTSNSIVTTSSPSATYFMDVGVEVTGDPKPESDIYDWLQLVFQNKWENCTSMNTTTTAPTTTLNTKNPPTSPTSMAPKETPTPTPRLTNDPAVRMVSADSTGSTTSNTITGGDSLHQGIEVSCAEKKAIRNTTCAVTLTLKQSVPPCCIFRKFCLANQNSRQIHVKANRVGRVESQSTVCNNDTHDSPTEGICVSAGTDNRLCGSYTAMAQNSTQCKAEKNVSCSCAGYCSRNDSYYHLRFSIRDRTLTPANVYTTISQLLRKPQPCTSVNSCLLSNISSVYQNVSLVCGNRTSDVQNCSLILKYSREVPVCAVSSAVRILLQERISFDGLMTQAAMCGDTVNPLTSGFTVMAINLTPSQFCASLNLTTALRCQKDKYLVVLLAEVCNHTQVSPNMTTPNTTATANTAEMEANALLDLTRDVSKLNSSQVEQLVSQLENLLSGPTVSLALGNISVNIVSNLLGASPEVLDASSTRIIGIIDTVGLKLILEGQSETLLAPAVALSVKAANRDNFQETFFSISDPSQVQVRDDSRIKRSLERDSSIPQGSIRLPPMLTQNLTSQDQQLASRVQFNFYQKSTVFQDQSLGDRKLISGILGASVANLSITGLQEDVVIVLKNTQPIPGNYVATCVFWDFTRNNGSGGWNSDGCVVRNSTDNKTICACNHLTSFAILLDLNREPLTDRVQATILTFITYIGCGVSSIFLAVTLLTYLAFGKVRMDVPSKILIQLCLALLLLNMVFLVNSWLALYSDTLGLCISTAWFLHYFLLVAFTWMGLEAVHMYLALVKVFHSHISLYKLSLVGWGIPLLVVIIVIAIDKDNYGLVTYAKYTDGSYNDFCWLKSDIAFYVAVVAYYCVIFLFNLVMFIVVLVKVRRMRKQNPRNTQHRATTQDVRSVIGLMTLLGLTWGFAFFAWGPVNLAFMYLFAIFNGLQGFFIFVFYCVGKENVRRQWRTHLCCGKLRLSENSEWSRTATQKTAKKSSLSRPTMVQSFKSIHSNTSSSFLVNDSPEQLNGTGSPFADSTITADEEPRTDVVLNEINRQKRNHRVP
ncbi:adhesion G-protein coupled receptor G2 isoform X2 [Genypterus blacodes]|uniref:adhesion G-protein coupled receptor G2 isoform X2 n=1 Tax=Genypterus blacodes TaxID=154954 RepID=UPI003F75E96C